MLRFVNYVSLSVSLAIFCFQVPFQDCFPPRPVGSDTSPTSSCVRKPVSAEGLVQKICTVCEVAYKVCDIKIHRRTEVHKQATEDLKRKPMSPILENVELPSSSAVQDEIKVPKKEKYWMRTGNDENSEANELYVNTLVVFLGLRYCFGSADNSDVQISINNQRFGGFGDVVLEIKNKEEEVLQIYAFQIKQTQYRRQIPLSTISAEKGKFSLRRQYEIFNTLRKKKHFEKTFFTLLTISDLAFDDNTQFVYDEETLSDWNESTKQFWKDKEVIVTKYKKHHPGNTTDDSDNICIFKILKHRDADLVSDLERFTFFVNQKKTEEIREVIKRIIEDKFVPRTNITNDLIQSIGNYFKKRTQNYYKLTKKQFLLKIPELILAPHHNYPDSLYEAKNLEIWNQVIKSFDVIVIQDDKESINKIYTCLNHILPKCGCFSLQVEKDSLENNSLKYELFDGFEEASSRYVSLPTLYTCLWKSGLAPLVIQAKTEYDLSKISSVFSFLKTYNLPMKFILATDQRIERCTFPQNLKIMHSLKDLEHTDENLLLRILFHVEVPILGVMVRLGDIVKHNSDFLSRITPDTFLNILLDDFSFKNITVPMTGDLIDNTFVLETAILDKLKPKMLQVQHSGGEYLEYVVNIKGHPSTIQVPADL